VLKIFSYLLLFSLCIYGDSFTTMQQTNYLFFGAFGMMLVYNLGYFIITNSTTYASYFMFHLSLFIVMLFYTQTLQNNWFDFNIQNIPVGVFFLSVVMFIAFSRDFLRLEHCCKKIKNYFDKLIMLNMVFIVLSAFAISTPLLENIAICLIATQAFTLLLFCIYLAFYKHNIYARFYVFSFSFLFLVLISVSLKYFNLLNYTYNDIYLIELAILLEMSGLSFALTYQYRQTSLDLKQKKLLFKELSHRVQNNLQQIISILSIQISKNKDIKTKEYLQDTINRIGSISLIHKTLQHSQDVGKTDMYIFLNTLVKGYKALHKNIIFNITCQKNFMLDFEKSASLSLILNELITNSLKHAFKDTQDNHIDIELSKQEQICLIYKDNGCGFDKDSVSNSVGMQLIDILTTTQLKGKTDIDSKNRYFFSLTFET